MSRLRAESVLDAPKEGMCPSLWTGPVDAPQLTQQAQEKIDKLISWMREQNNFTDLSVYLIGSMCSNSYSASSDIDIDFCDKPEGLDPDDEEAVRDFGWKMKENFIKNYAEVRPDDAQVDGHPFEVYFSTNPFQCFMSIGCYNVLEKKWEVLPDIKDQGFDPVSEYYADAMKQVDGILKDIRSTIFELYEEALACMQSADESFKAETASKMMSQIDTADSLFKKMKTVRANFQKPCKSKEEALKRRNDRKQHVVDAAFKLLDKFGYIKILKDIIQVKYDIEDGNAERDDYDGICMAVLKSVSSNMQLKHLQDSEDEKDLKFAALLKESCSIVDESVPGFVKMSFIAALMAISSFIPANALTKNLEKAHKQDKNITVNSPSVKKAIADAAKDNEMVGPMSKTNVVNAVARCLWAEGRGKKEGTEGRKAIASVIVNRTGNRPECIIDVIKQPAAFTYTSQYTGGWTDSTYNWFLPYKAIAASPSNKEIWDECNQIALQVVDGKFKSTIGNCNSYMNKETAEKKNVESWGKKCTLKVGSHHFGYLADRDPKYVIPGTFTPVKSRSVAGKKSSSSLAGRTAKSAAQNSKSSSTAPSLKKNAAKMVIVKRGDTLSNIAQAHNTTVAKLLKLNKGSLPDPDSLSIGQKIRVS